MRTTESVLGVDVDVVTWGQAVERIFTWASARVSKTVCICNVHNVVTALKEKPHAANLKSADMVTPDGAPVAWMLRKKGHYGQDRISGPDLMEICCERAQAVGEKMFLYGGTPATLSILEQSLRLRYPGLQIAGSYSPPFRPLTKQEDAEVVSIIERSGAGIVWVGLGCPKQEAWMQAHRGRINAVMIGVGAAFDFHAGTIKRAPRWMQKRGLEWLYRLSQDPRRLAMRYLTTNTIFILAAMRELFLYRQQARRSSQVRVPIDSLDKR